MHVFCILYRAADVRMEGKLLSASDGLVQLIYLKKFVWLGVCCLRLSLILFPLSLFLSLSLCLSLSISIAILCLSSTSLAFLPSLLSFSSLSQFPSHLSNLSKLHQKKKLR